MNGYRTEPTATMPMHCASHDVDDVTSMYYSITLQIDVSRHADEYE